MRATDDPQDQAGRELSLRGRPPKGAEPMRASERSMRRMGRLAGIEAAAAETTERLFWLHRELSDDGLPDRAGKVAQIIKINALRAAAEYTRRNSAYFAHSGPGMLSAVEVEWTRGQISDVAGQIDNLAREVVQGRGTYRQFEQYLERLRGFGFWIDGGLVSATARAFTLG